MLEQLWLYLTVFVMAATPWLEILFVVPIGIGLGLHPMGVAFVSFIGNALPVVLIIYLYQWFMNWRDKKKKEEKESKPSPSSKRRERANRIIQKYGIPGLAFLGPLITGIHLATIIAISLKGSKQTVLLWMSLSLVIWTLFLTVASFYGIEWILNFMGK